ncbi:Cytochrome c551 peroxidase [hydrothermal vent metagenome]|uniref:Cytochrome c551 peroxidase n=1 Tax=hydrothermal vent metagenome TaxID=652676 RepID=A0A1W1CGW1_9ZZZZ
MKKSLVSMVAILALSTAVNAEGLLDQAKKSGLSPIPSDKASLMKLIDNPNNPITEEKVELGKKLFFDPRLSKSSLISCNTCHNLAIGGVDGVSAATGHKWTANPHHLNSPTVYNAVFMGSQFWDGRDPDLEKQAQGPMQAAPEMAISKEMAQARVASMPAYVEEFKKAYGDEKITFERISDTIATFERTLVTPSRFDKFLEGDTKALSDDEKAGLKLFIDKGCVSCHNGVALGGSMQPFPAVKPFKYAKVGDFKGDKNGMVKVPTLRNINQTAPYFHNGTVWSLAEAVEIMAETQLGTTLTKDETASIVTFFKALEGKKPDINYPQLPEVTKTTPNPDMN